MAAVGGGAAVEQPQPRGWQKECCEEDLGGWGFCSVQISPACRCGCQ